MNSRALTLPGEYTTALSERFKIDLSTTHLKTREGKEYIAKTAEIVSKITKGLTKTRSEFFASGYLRNKEIREAYELYYMTTNVLKIYQPLYELSLANFFEISSPLRILDLGTGTGAAAWGVMCFLLKEASQLPLEFILSDTLTENLNESELFFHYFSNNFILKSQCAFSEYDLSKPEIIPEAIRSSSPFHLITMMNVLNELDEAKDTELLESIMSLLDENGALIIIEPATRIESRRLLRFRDFAVSQGITIYSPCFRQGHCPALIDPDDWCHNSIEWERPAFIKAIDDLTGNLRLSLKFTYMIIRKNGETLNNSFKQNLYRVVSERFDEKGRIRAILCGENGRTEFIMNKRDISESNTDFTKIERYDSVFLSGEEWREHDIRLPKESGFQIVLPILGAR